jgi:hypothetical protein
MSNEIVDNPQFSKVAELIEIARKKVATTVNLTMVHTPNDLIEISVVNGHAH